MSHTWNDVDFDVIYDGDGALPLPTYASNGSARHISNSAEDIVQYTGTGLPLIALEIFCTRANYNLLVVAYRTYPRPSHTLTLTDIYTGTTYIDAIGPAKSYLNQRVRTSIVFRGTS